MSSQLRHVSTIGKFVKQQHLLHMSPQYRELRLANGWDLLASLGHHNKLQLVLRLGFVTAPTSLNGGQQNFAECLAVYWTGTLYIHFWRLLPFNGLLPATKFALRPSLATPILAALLHGTRAAAVSQTLWRGKRNRITKRSHRAPPIFDWAAITLGIGPHSSCYYY